MAGLPSRLPRFLNVDKGNLVANQNKLRMIEDGEEYHDLIRHVLEFRKYFKCGFPRLANDPHAPPHKFRNYCVWRAVYLQLHGRSS